MRVLVIAAHPDDEILGVGGAINKYSRNGDEVFVYIVTDGSTSQYPNDIEKLNNKKQEALEANKVLGVKEVIFGDLPDMKLDQVPHVKLNAEIEKVINKINPEIIYTHHHGDINKDHRLIFESTFVAVRPNRKDVKKVFTYEVLSSSEWGNIKSEAMFSPNTYSVLKEIDIINKKNAMEKYKTELREYPHPRSIDGIENLAKYRGNQICENFAESFILIRGVE
ncbi:MAG: PIG-L deacetylase family protein [Fusobacteriaceae bacterium]